MAFNVSALGAFKDELAGGDFFKLVGQGTLADAFNTYPVESVGTQQLNVNNSDLKWDVIDVNGTATTEYDTYTSDLIYGVRDLTVDGNAAQGYVTIPQLYGKYSAVGVNGDDDEAAVRRFSAEVAAKSRLQYAQRLYTGFGLGTPTNGLNTVIGTELDVTGGTTVTSANIIAKVDTMINAFLAIAGNNPLEGMPLSIVMKMADYRKLRSAYRAANYFNTSLGNESGFAVSEWIDNEQITIYGDPAYTGEMKIMYQDSVYVGTVNAGFHFEEPKVWYNIDKNAIGFRVAVFGGAQILEATHGRTVKHVA